MKLKLSRLIFAIFALAFFGNAFADIAKHAERIDQFILENLKRNDLQPTKISSDQTFLRRIYLDIIGRIPTLKEARAFLNSQSPTKRSELITSLLSSKGAISREFNYWADLLRVQSRLRNAPAKPYLDWLKDSLQKNKAYDAMVRELIMAEGYLWENGAAGYYMRDAGMPLDHMANSFQVFLGTQLVCAQCHDHPYDAFTQMDYYQQAAYIYGVKTRDRAVIQKYRSIHSRKQKDAVSPETQRIARQMIRPLRYRVHEIQSKLRLPEDYQYEDAKPKSVVVPHTIFGETISLNEWQSPREAYADWLTSPDNPRFATVIANRLWKRTMGVGVIEPVDDLSDGFSASHPGLMEYLTTILIELDFDLRRFLEIIYNTRTYQRNVCQEEWEAGRPFFFEGPILKRMTAEQWWDSIVGLIVEDLDDRRGNPARNANYARAEKLVGMAAKDILKIANERAELEKARRQIREIRQKLKIAKTDSADENAANIPKLRDLQKSLSAKIAQLQKAQSNPRNGNYRRNRPKDPRWKGLSAEWVRASELESPAPPGHFLRQFGQSDRQTIENANEDANVPQILTLLNGSFYAMFQNQNALLRKTIQQASDANEVLEAIFLSILSRPPSPDERDVLLPKLRANPNEVQKDLIWALLNTRQFAFIQ